MLDSDELRTIAFHGRMHEMGMCLCPCYPALIDIGKKLMRENELRLKLAKASPEALAGLIIGVAEADGDGRDPEQGDRKSGNSEAG